MTEFGYWMSDSKYSKLLKNSAVFLIGNFGSKIISFLIVPFYTYCLTAAEYGEADLVSTTVNLVAPFVMIGMNEAVLRYSVSKEADYAAIASSSLFTLVLGCMASFLLFPLLSQFSVIGDNIALFFALLLLTCFNGVFLQFLRGIGNTRAFAANGVIVTFTMAVSNVLALAVFHLGVGGYLFSLVVSQMIGSVHIIISARLWRYISLHKLNLSVLGSMLSYCVPLIPNALMWWMMSASNRYVILYNLGSSANGIFNVAQKIPSIVNIIYSIFLQAWQISAIEEHGEEDNAKFQTTVFKYMFALLAVISSLIAATAYPVNSFLMSASYENSWKPMAVLALANLFSCLSSFFGTSYVVSKRTKRAFSTTASGAVINVALTILLVPLLGVMGAAVAMSISYGVIASIRAKDMRKSVEIKYDKKRIAMSLMLVVVQALLPLAPIGYFACTVLSCSLLVLLLIVLRDDLSGIIRIAVSIVSRRKNGLL